MEIAQDYHEHGYVQKKDKGYVLLISGEMKIDYERLVEVYVDDFWRNYRKCHSNLKEKMESAYKYCWEWARIDWKLRHEEQQQKEMDH